MAEARKKKIAFTIPKDDVASFFRKLGEDVQAGSVSEAGVDLDGCAKVKLSIKDKGDAYRVRLKVKFPRPEDELLSKISALADLAESEDELDEADELQEPSEPAFSADAGTPPQAPEDEPSPPAPDERPRPKYKALKKRMGRTFKSVAASLAGSAAPAADDLASFVADSRLMCSFPGLGDEFYSDYLELVGRLTALVGQGDPESLREALAVVGALNQMKKDCHARHK